MYSPRRSYGSPPPELSNNPFIDHPANALARYPDISGGSGITNGSNAYPSSPLPSGSNPGYGGSYLGAGQPTGYGGGYQQPQQTGWAGTPGGYQQQPQQPQQPQGYGSGFASTPMQSQSTGAPFQPSSTFGQQLASQMTGYPGQQQQQQQPQQYGASPYATGYQTGYPPSQPQPTQQPYLAEFDPYSRQAQQQTQQMSKQPSNASVGSSGGASQNGYRPPHPREYIHQHKAELESWDPYAWKQIINSFEGLKDAWGVRKQEIEARGRSLGGAGLFAGGNMYGGYNGQAAQEMAMLEQLSKEAENNYNSVAASIFQMQEVHKGYRQSGDIASKRRVRENINAALSSLPDWPAQY